MEKYDWITTEMFDAKLAELLDKMSGAQVLAIPGVFEIVSEELNNEALAELSAEREATVPA